MAKQIVFISCFILSVLVTGCNKRTEQKDNNVKVIKQDIKKKSKKQGGNFTVQTKVKDVIKDPAFKGYGRLIFQADIKIEDDLTLKNIEEILPWYSEINPKRTVEIVNYMKNELQNGNQIFYDIYTDQEKKEDPDKRNIGLFFFKGKAGAKTAITNAGGGFMYVAGIHDSFPHALELSKKGYNAFALIYRPGAQTACEDLARAIAFLYEHQKELQIDMKGYSLWGGSAGARMAAWLG